MSALPKEFMSADEFLAWVATQLREAGRFELIDGLVVMQQSERAVHWEVKLALAIAIRDAIRRAGRPCFTAVDGPTVRRSRRKVYRPDGLVYCGERAPPDVTEINTPCIIWEVLSPESAERDTGEKLEGYFALPDVHHYLIVDPIARRIVWHQRGTGPALATRTVTEGSIVLDPPGLEIAVADVFERG